LGGRRRHRSRRTRSVAGGVPIEPSREQTVLIGIEIYISLSLHIHMFTFTAVRETFSGALDCSAVSTFVCFALRGFLFCTNEFYMIATSL
jgi:hypothetical protein